MKRLSIANTNIEVSAVGLGTVKLGRDQGVNYPQSFSIPDDAEACDLLGLAKDLGINLIDTAPAYGSSEERLGNLLKGQRHDWVICTKTGEEFKGGHSYFDFTPEHTRESVTRSLQRLQTDYLDIVLVHSDGNDVDIIQRYGIFDTLAELKKSGLIRAYGMSTKSVEGGKMAADKSDIVMATYNPQMTEDKPVLDYCLSRNKAVFVKKALASGHLPETDGDPIQQSMDFVYQHSAVTSVIIGTINPVHLKANVKAAESSLIVPLH